MVLRMSEVWEKFVVFGVDTYTTDLSILEKIGDVEFDGDFLITTNPVTGKKVILEPKKDYKPIEKYIDNEEEIDDMQIVFIDPITKRRFIYEYDENEKVVLLWKGEFETEDGYTYRLTVLNV